MVTTELISYLTLGSALGLSAGISPGPLLTLVISETLQHGRREGIKVALSPLVTDLPIILISLLILAGMGKSTAVLSLISFAGAVFLSFLGWECLRTRELTIAAPPVRPRSLQKGITANLLNPHPYLFWITVGGPTAVRAWHSGYGAAIVFFVTFYLFLTGSKIATAFLVSRSGSFLKGKAYQWMMRALGAVLFFFAALFMGDGIRMLGNRL